jgi:hypothetical protein
MNPELKETRELCKVLTQFLGNYLQATRGTSDAEAAEKAAGRVTDWLSEGLSKATIELSGETFECSSCGGPHDMGRDRAALLSGKFRWPVCRGTVEERRLPASDYVVLRRAFRYSDTHAKEAMRQLELRGYQSTAVPQPRRIDLVPA